MGILRLPEIFNPDFSTPKGKPKGPVEVRWDNAATLGMKFCEIFRDHPRDMVAGNIPDSATNGGLIYGVNEPAWDFDDSSSDRLRYGRYLDLEGIENLTIITRARFDDTSADQALVGKVGFGTGWFENGFLLFGDISSGSGTNEIHMYVASAATASRASTADESMNPGVYQDIVGTFEGGVETRIYLNGVEGDNSPVTAVSVADTGTNTEDLDVGSQHSDVGKDLDGAIEYMYIFDNILPPAVWQSIIKNPYQRVVRSAIEMMAPTAEEAAAVAFHLEILEHNRHKNRMPKLGM